MNVDFSKDIREVMIAIEHDPTVKSIAVTAEQVFSAGGDLKEFASLGDELPSPLGLSPLPRCDLSHESSSKPFIAGFVVPQVVQVCRSCVHLTWWLLANPRSSRWDTPSSDDTDGTSTYFLARHIGLRRAMELTLTNRVECSEALD